MLNDELDSIKVAICHGDVNAYEQLFRAAYPVLKRFIGNLVMQERIAEELAADVLIGIWLKREDLRDIVYFKAYIYKSARNAGLNFLRQKNPNLNYADVENIAPLINNYTPETAFMTNELRSRIMKVIQALPPKCKTCFQLVKEEHLSYKEVSEILGISVKTIESQITIAIKKIAMALTPILK